MLCPELDRSSAIVGVSQKLKRITITKQIVIYFPFNYQKLIFLMVRTGLVVHDKTAPIQVRG